MGHSKSLKELTIMSVKWIYQMSIVLVLLSIFFFIFLFDIGGDSRSNPIKNIKDYAIQTTPNDPLEV